jgi:hypothetical protein
MTKSPANRICIATAFTLGETGILGGTGGINQNYQTSMTSIFNGLLVAAFYVSFPPTVPKFALEF